MGAERFMIESEGLDPRDAFNEAVEDAAYDHSHGGYTGTIAEKEDFVIIDVPNGVDPEKYAEKLLDDDDERIENKWGPAGCILLEKGEEINRYLFFGCASS